MPLNRYICILQAQENRASAVLKFSNNFILHQCFILQPTVLFLQKIFKNFLVNFCAFQTMDWNAKAGLSEGGLACYDFIPKCIRPNSLLKWPKFESFSTLLDPANDFLKKNPSLSVKSCETSHFRVEKDHLENADSSSFHEVGEGSRPFVKGLRLWVTPRKTEKSDPDQIGYVTFVPQLNKDAINTLADLTEKVNEYLQKNPLPGKLISLESLQMRGIKEGNNDVDASCWKPKVSLSTLKLGLMSLFRIWYVHGEPKYEAIGIADFFPSTVQCEISSSAKPQLQKLTDVMNNVNSWVSSLPSNVKIININTITTRADPKTWDHQAYTTFLWAAGFHRYYLKFIRVAYVVSPQPSAPPTYQSRQLTTKLFTPGLIQDPTWRKAARYESQTEIKERMDDWIRKTGSNIAAVETLVHKTRSGAEGRDGFDVMHTWNETHYDPNTHTEQPSVEEFLTSYRIYLEGKVDDPAGFQWPRSIEDYQKEHPAKCIVS